MSRWFPMAALLGALVLSAVAGCGSSPTTGPNKGGSPTSPGSSTGKPSDGVKDTAPTTGRTHNPG